VPKAGIKSDFGDDIGRGVEPVGPQAVEGFAVARLAQQEIVSVSMCGKSGLRIFDGDSEPNLIAEVFG
jgi:hypothetical protein